mgnify:CR=1 FL=1
MIELFVAEIAGRAVLALNAESAEAAQAILAEPGVRADLKAFRSGEAALWNGRDAVYLREPFPEERALWEASFLDAIGRSGAARAILSAPKRSSVPLVILLGKKPGASALTVMPCSPHSPASVRVKFTTAPLLVP